MCDLHAGIHPYADGQVALSHDALCVHRALDALFGGLADELSASEYRFPPMIAAEALDRTGYFHSFPHIVSFPVSLRADEATLRAFADGNVLDDDGSVRLGPLAPVHSALTPAACYHFYALLAGRELPAPLRLTTSATCFRTEPSYAALARQRSFSMREIVCIGTGDEVATFLLDMRARIERLLDLMELPMTFAPATDSFFDPYQDPRFYAQRLSPLKTEIVFGHGLAVGSLNAHGRFFGQTFGIMRDGSALASGCVAFGLERWLLALCTQFGSVTDHWPAGLRDALGLARRSNDAQLGTMRAERT
jgi:seryl-tRNA synthetase